jgi:AAA+ ATPase superfamily predicted ATPase
MSGLKTYLLECLRLLYWAFFKPFTLRSYLQDIHPDLKPYSDPFRLLRQNPDNAQLRRYADQAWWLALAAPWVVAVIAGMLLPLLLPQALPVQGGIPQFDWQDSLLFLGGWTLGLLIARATSRLRFWAISFLLLCFVAGLLFAGLSRLAPGLTLSILQLIHEQAFDVIVGLWPLAGGVALGVAVGLGALRAYFWLPELAWMLALAAALSQGKNAARMLPLLPPRFDQLIILPLPFMDKIIVKAHRENPAAAQQFIRYLTSETNQQAVAARAMRGIAEDVLARCQAVQDIVHAADQLAWLPTPLPKGFSPFFAELLDVSKGVRAAMQATSPYRQSQELARQIGLLEGIQNRLAAAGHMSDATTFGGVAKRWLGLLQALRQSLEARAKATEEIPQVYLPASALEPDLAGGLFRGREDIFRQIEDVVLAKQPQTLLLYGGRRAGKTSTLNYLPRRITPDVVPLKVDLQGVVTAQTLAGLAVQLATHAARAGQQLGVMLNMPNPADFQTDPFPALERWMDSVERTVGQKRILLCLDEYERLGEFVEAFNNRAPLNFLRYVIQNRRRWIILLSGSHLLDELPGYWSDYLINTRPIRVSYLEREAARSLIVSPVDGFPDIYTPETVDAILEMTRCQPYLVQLACYEIVERLNHARRKRASPDDLQAVVPVMFERGSEYFRELWESLADEERSILRRLARNDPSLRLETSLVEDGMGTYLRRLVRREIIEQHDGIYRFQVPLIQQYVLTEAR